MMMGRPGAERPNMMSPMGQRGMMQQQPEQRIDPFTGEPIAPNEEEEEARKAREEAMEKEQKPPEFKLFRFLDFNVEAGKSYMYRVCLAVENPNYQRQAVFLANPSDKDSQFLVGEWSEPSPVITVPPDSRLLVKTVKLSPSSITAVLTKWLVDKGIEAFTEPQAFYRGQLANLMGQSFEPTVAAHAAPMAGMYGGPGPGGMGGGMMAGGSGSAPARGAMAGGSGSAPPRAAAGGGSGSAPSRAGAAAGRNPAAPVGNNNDAEPIDVDYVTNVVVVDFRGGGKLPGRKDPVTEPAEVLLLDLNGNLTVRSEVDDLAAINEVTGVVEEPEPSATAGQGGVSPFGLENALGGGNNKKTPKKTGSGRGAN
jgi:hypothetical protein